MRKPDEKKPSHEVSDEGRDYLENPREEIEGEEPKVTTESNYRRYYERYYRGCPITG